MIVRFLLALGRTRGLRGRSASQRETADCEAWRCTSLEIRDAVKRLDLLV